MCSKDADRISNREDPDQTAPWGAVWSGSALFAQTYLSQYLELLRYLKPYFLPAEPSCSSATDAKDTGCESNSIPAVEGTAIDNVQSSQAPKSQVAKVIGILPSALGGLQQYSDTSDSESSSSDDADCDFSLAGRNQIAMTMRELKEQIQQHSQG